MENQDPEPIVKAEECIENRADITVNSLQDKSRHIKKELKEERDALSALMKQLPENSLELDSKGVQSTLKQIELLKEKIAQKHDELMEILKNEEKISKTIQQSTS
ncbi:MAG: hypothetical protein COT85_00555 [Chlamydiae bacterium CG10_big_fil_rev_8_21_14_0_10_42_34]|nr:MAG: hypothetical protein COT85_00555 [Chlamydiae bacterium CG10_big_fil_rev_8_21_14_0_10_42_34]